MTKKHRIGICKLCLNEKQLCQSHIFPEFFYKPLYDPEKHTMHAMSTAPEIKNKYPQKGIWEYLLCSDCESLLNDQYENYAQRILYHYQVSSKSKIYNNCYHINDINYTKFKLFEVSLLWRSIVSTRREFKIAETALKHKEKMRKMILDCDPGRYYEYGCIISLIRNDNNLVDDLVLMPDVFKKDGHTCFHFILGGFYWFFIVSSHMEQFPGKDSFLSEYGRLVIYRKNIKDFPHIRKYAIELFKQGKVK